MMHITYFDPLSIGEHAPDGIYTVTANTPEEYAAHRAAILNPERGITLIDPPELPEEPDPSWFPLQLDTAALLDALAEELARGYGGGG